MDILGAGHTKQLLRRHLYRLRQDHRGRSVLILHDGSSLSVDGVAVVQNLEFHSYNRVCGIIHLLAGVHSLIVSYYQIEDDAGVLLTYSGPDTSNIEVVLQRPSAVSTFPSIMFYPPVDPRLS